MNSYETLSAVDVRRKAKKKNGLTYLSWVWAWDQLQRHYPGSTYHVYENADGWNYFTDGRTCWVKVGVTIGSVEHVEMLPVMDYHNKSIAADKVTSMDVTKAIQRAATKAIARHGLGLSIYAGEDLPQYTAENTKDDRMIDEAEIETLKKCAVKAYGDKWAYKLAQMMEDFEVDNYGQINLTIKRQMIDRMKKDYQVKEVRIS